jgi:hypothetical protein
MQQIVNILKIYGLIVINGKLLFWLTYVTYILYCISDGPFGEILFHYGQKYRINKINCELLYTNSV